MALNINESFYFLYNSSYTKTQLSFLLIWSCIGTIMIFITPFFFVSYIIPIVGFSFLIYLLKAFKGSYIVIKDHQLRFGTLYKTNIDLRTVRRIKNFGEDYIIKTDDFRNYTLPSKCIAEKDRMRLHEFFIQYTHAHGVIFP